MSNESTSAPLEMSLLDALYNSWRRHNVILANLLVMASEHLDARATSSSPTIAELYTHIHHERMVSVLENAPESAGAMPAQEWIDERDPVAIATMLEESERCVENAVTRRLNDQRILDKDFAHPSQLIHFLLFHESYHHGQIKIALKAAGVPITDEQAGPLIWDVWRRR
jgi:uncharacterized damage-inducible protein DinB